MKEEHVISLFEKKSNAMSRPCKWKDKFENFLMNFGYDIDGRISENTTKDDMVAQCWTMQKYSEAMWAIYANKTDCRYLRIRSTPKKLLKGLRCACPEQARIYVGKVKYEREGDLKKCYDKAKKRTKVSMECRIKSLLLKRKAFLHECEVRLIYFNPSKEYDEDGFYRYDVDPHSMITQIMADPNRDRGEWCRDKKKIISVTKFKGEVKRSKIYDRPDW